MQVAAGAPQSGREKKPGGLLAETAGQAALAGGAVPRWHSTGLPAIAAGRFRVADQKAVRTPTMKLRPPSGTDSRSTEVDRRMSWFSRLRASANQVSFTPLRRWV